MNDQERALMDQLKTVAHAFNEVTGECKKAGLRLRIQLSGCGTSIWSIESSFSIPIRPTKGEAKP